MGNTPSVNSNTTQDNTSDVLKFTDDKGVSLGTTDDTLDFDIDKVLTDWSAQQQEYTDIMEKYIKDKLPEDEYNEQVIRKEPISGRCVMALKKYDEINKTERYDEMVKIITAHTEFTKDLNDVLYQRGIGNSLTISPVTYKLLIKKCDDAMDSVRVGSQLDKQLEIDNQ